MLAPFVSPSGARRIAVVNYWRRLRASRSEAYDRHGPVEYRSAHGTADDGP